MTTNCPGPERPTDPPCLAAALEYLARGWSPLPLIPPDADQEGAGKRPIIKWQKLQEERATEAQLRLWFGRWPGANVGVALGPVSGLIGLDIDGEAGEDILREWQEQHGRLPVTLEFTTGHGRRLLFAWPSAPVPNEQYSFGRGGEVRILAKGRQTVMPPSIHPGGARYTWDPSPDRPAEFPGWLIDKLTNSSAPPPARRIEVNGRTPDNIARAVAYLRKCDPAISGSGGHNQTIKVAIHLVRGFSVEPETALALLLQEYNPRCLPPWSEKELQHKVDSAVKAALKEGRQDGYLAEAGRPAGYWYEGTNEERAPDDGPEGEGPAGAPTKGKGPKPKPSPQLTSAAALMRLDFPEVRWAVPGMLGEGATLLAGRPKKGKSWLSLGIALSVAAGGVALGKVPVARGRVLYLALEDGPRRLQRRLRAILGPDAAAPEGLEFATNWLRHKEGGIGHVAEWLARTESPRLIVIDTLARVRDKRAAQGAVYEEDYEAVSQLQELGVASGVAILIVHHTRKTESEDPFDTISGSFGLTGAADAMMILQRPNRSNLAALHITGRDLPEEKKLQLEWDGKYCLWQLKDGPESEEDTLSEDRQAVLAAIRGAGRSLSVAELMKELAKAPDEYDGLAKLVQRMVRPEELLVKEGYGRYALPKVQAVQLSN